MIKLLFRYLFLSFLLLFVHKGYAQSAFIEHFDVKDGLPSNTCFYTLQDSKGYIWVGTDAGISRFDGKYFRNFSIDDGLPDNQVLQIKEDSKGRIWFLSFSGKPSYYHNGKIYNERNSSLLRLLKFKEIIVSLFEDKQGRLWFGSNDNLLYCYDGKKLIKYASKDHNKQFINAVVHQDKQGQIWVISQHIAMIFNEKSFYEVPNVNQSISYKTITSVVGGKLLYLDSKGINLLSQCPTNIPINVPTDMLNNKLGFIYATESELWLSNTEGVFVYGKNKSRKRYLPNIPASQVIKDKNNNMWFTTTNGIYMLPRQENRMYIINKDFGLSSNYIKSITKDNKQRLWLGLDNGRINMLDKGKPVKEIHLSKLGVKSNVKQLLVDSAEGSLYFGTDRSIGRIIKLYSVDPTIDLINEKAHLILAIKNFSISKENKLAIATASGVFLLDDPVNKFEFHALRVKDGINFHKNRAYAAFFDKAGTLWFSNTAGLGTAGLGKLLSAADKNFFNAKRINDIKELDDGVIVVATDGFGLVFLKDGKIIKKITIAEGLADNICKKLFSDGDHIWVITNNGINRVRINGSHSEVQGFEFTNALLKNDVNDLYIGKDTAYFATNNGLIFFAKKGIERKFKAPEVLISSVLNNGSLLQVEDSLLSLDPSKNNITFIYSAIDFQNQDLSYRYRLKPGDNWIVTKNRRLEFSSLSPGDYIFEVSAKSNNTNWSDSTKIKFKLEEHFWQRNWFILMLLIAASFSFYKIAVVITKWQKNQEQKQLVLKHKILILEQRALQAMMNPHFIFNVMNSIQHYINTKDTSSANKVLTGFARLIRKNLEICTKSFISLEEELDYLNLYLGLEKKRFGEKFNYKINIDPSIDKEELFIPSMLLQPYIENAIWHGIMPKEEGGNIEISMEIIHHDFLQIYILDDGIGIDNSMRVKKGSHSSKGMSLTQERVNLLNQIESISIRIEISQRGNSGTLVTIQVPI